MGNCSYTLKQAQVQASDKHCSEVSERTYVVQLTLSRFRVLFSLQQWVGGLRQLRDRQREQLASLARD